MSRASAAIWPFALGISDCASRVAEQLALPLQVGPGAGHFARQAESMCQFFGAQRGLAGFAVNSLQLLLGKLIGRLAVRQPLHLLTADRDLPAAQGLQACSQRLPGDGTPHNTRQRERRETFAPRLLQALPPRVRLRAPLRDALLQALKPRPFALLAALQRLGGFGATGQQQLALRVQLRTACLGGPGLVSLGHQGDVPGLARLQHRLRRPKCCDGRLDPPCRTVQPKPIGREAAVFRIQAG